MFQKFVYNLPKGYIKPPTFSEFGIRHEPKGQDSVDQGTIHICSGGPKFGERYRTFRSQTPKIRWSWYQSSIGIYRGPTLRTPTYQSEIYVCAACITSSYKRKDHISSN